MKKSISFFSFFLLIFTLNSPVNSEELDQYVIEESNRAAALMGQFNFSEAFLRYSSLVEKYPNQEELKTNKAIALLNRQSKGDEEQAFDILSEVVTSHPDHLRAIYCKALLLLHRGKLQNALDNFTPLLLKRPSDPDLLYFTGKTLMQLDRPKEALEFFNRVISTDPYLSSGYYGAIMAYRLLGSKEKAMEMISQYREIKDNPKARTAEFKYTKMGDLALVNTLDQPFQNENVTTGPLFQTPKTIIVQRKDREIIKNFQSSSDITFADINNDNIMDLFIPGGKGKNLLLLGKKDLLSFDLMQNHPLVNIDRVNNVLWGDINDDGLLDAYILRDGFNQLWLQQDDRSWLNSTEQSLTAGEKTNTISGALFDADHDGDLDIFCINSTGENELFNNNRDSTFKRLAREKNLTANGSDEPGSNSILIHDFDNDRDIDILVINRAKPHQVFINDRLWKYSGSEKFTEFIKDDFVASTMGDLDNDGKREIYTLSQDGTLNKWINREKWFKSIGYHIIAQKLLDNPRISLTDVDGDTKMEVLLLTDKAFRVYDAETLKLMFGTDFTSAPATGLMHTKEGPVLVTKEPGKMIQIYGPGAGRLHFAMFSFSGRKEREANLRTNSSGIGTKLNFRIGASWTSVDTNYNDLSSGQSHQPLSIGMGHHKRIDFVQIEWPDGVFQTEMALDAGKLHRIYETQRQMSSCPVLFSWNGSKYEFVSDLLGVGGIGYAIGPGEYAEPRPWENFLLPLNSIAPVNSTIRLKMTEPMEEVEYLDHVSMTAYDLPPGWNMVLDERMGIMGPQPTGKPFFYRETIAPEKAINDRNLDVTDFIKHADFSAAPVGQLDRRFIGMLAAPHTLTLLFPKTLTAGKRLPVLVAHGWVEYPYSQTSFAAWQAGAHYNAPSIEIRRKNGQWESYLDQFGYPAGMVRQMAMPLYNLPDDVSALRITTNQEIYWDKLFIAYSEPLPAVQQHMLNLSKADLHTIGFPKRIDFDQRRPYYDYAKRDLNWGYRIPEGDYTRFGDVMELLEAKDSALAIIGPGEEIHMEFSVPRIAPKSGWTRRYILNSHGWCKDMDLFTHTGDTVSPLPAIPKEEHARQLHHHYNRRYQIGKKW